MAYTVTEAYTKVLQEGDKMGSDYFTQAEVLSRFKKCTIDFLGQKAAEVEITQQVTDDIRSLVTMKKISVIQDPDEAQVYLAAIPVDYHTRLGVKVQYVNGLFARQPNIERIGEHSSNMVNPYMMPDKDYPLIRQYANYFKINSSGTNIVTFFYLQYLKLPTFGVANNEEVVNLPIQAVEEIISMVVNSLLVEAGDPRASLQFQTKETSRKPR